MLVRLVYPENWTNTFRLIPNNDTKIGSIRFTTDEVNDADLIVVVNFSPKDIKINAREYWVFHQEPANDKFFAHWKKGYKNADRVFGSWDYLYTHNLIQEQPSIFWHASRSYDYYKQMECPNKYTNVSCITSAKKAFSGHKLRIKCLNEIKDKIGFEIKGRGFSPITSKDEVLLDSKYSIVIENTSEPHYFSEKLADALLCYNLPIYYGAPNIFDYFPKDSIIKLDSLEPAYVCETIENAIKNNLFEKNMNRINEARNLILDNYNFFINIVDKIEKFELQNKPVKKIKIPRNRQKKHPLVSAVKNSAIKLFKV